MDDFSRFVAGYGALVLFGAVFADQFGLPLPGPPILLATGALVGTGKMHFALAMIVAVAAAVLADLVWYAVGRRRGSRVLSLLCRVSLEPDSCVRRAQDVFVRHGLRSFLVARFVPGTGAVLAPLAGTYGVGLPRFLLYDGLGALVWAGSYTSLGYLFSDQLEQIATRAGLLGTTLLAVVAAAVGAYVVWKYVQRRRVLQRLRVARVTVEELRRRLDTGEEVAILDLRHALDVKAVPYAIPGALRMAVEEVERRHHEIPRDRDVVLYCT